jgi:hypothetical protein
MEVTPFEPVSDAAPTVCIRLPVELRESTVHRLREVLTEHPGDSPVVLEVGGQRLRLPPEFAVDARNGLRAHLLEVAEVDVVLA